MNNFSILNLTNKLFIVQKVKLGLLKLKVQSYSLDQRPVFEKLVHHPRFPIFFCLSDRLEQQIGKRFYVS